MTARQPHPPRNALPAMARRTVASAALAVLLAGGTLAAAQAAEPALPAASLPATPVQAVSAVAVQPAVRADRPAAATPAASVRAAESAAGMAVPLVQTAASAVEDLEAVPAKARAAKPRRTPHRVHTAVAAPVVAMASASLAAPLDDDSPGFLARAGKLMLAPTLAAAILAMAGFMLMRARARSGLALVRRARQRVAGLRVDYWSMADAGLGDETVVAPPPSQRTDDVTGPPAATPAIPPGFDDAGFLRHAKLNFIRFLEANERRDLDRLRDVTTEALYGALAADLRERGSVVPHAGVVTLEAALLEVVTERDAHWASVRFSGLMHERAGTAPTPFAELWHLTKPLAGQSGWLVAQIETVL